MIKNRIISFLLAAVSLAAFSFSASAATYYASDESGNTSIPDYVESIEISEDDVSISDKVRQNSYTYELTPDGNLTLIDDVAQYETDDEISQKQFLTVTTKAGNTFYIVVDRDGNTDNVYLLNLVDEADLMALINDEDVTVTTTSVDETEETSEANEDEEPQEKKSGNLKLFVIVAILGGGGFAYYWFKVKPKKDNTPVNEAPTTDKDADADMLFHREDNDPEYEVDASDDETDTKEAQNND